ncbi:glycosyltransferase [Devosia beringensis]|uniref:glycosyltransferase n=1 Tax=Devosia beringensis TaxID=2657486 RepID=UPI00186BA0C1|nr:glycosyltransferase [Devosia beringensis]
MKILIITHSFPPDLTPRAFRLAAIAEELAAQGHDVHVLCATGADAPYAGRARIHRVADPILGRRNQRPSSPAADRAPLAVKRSMVRRFKSMLVQAWRKVYWPDYACGWIIPASAAADRLQAEHGFDWVISTSHPFSGHVVWLRAGARATGTGWLVDIGDPYSQMDEPAPYNRLLYQGLGRWTEGRVLRRADRITVTTEATRRLYEGGFPVTRGKLAVIGPLLSLPPSPVRTRPRGGAIRIVFVGTLYRTIRNPAYFLDRYQALRAARPDKTYEMHFYGAVNDCHDILQRHLVAAPGSIVVHGLVEREEVTRAMAEADAVLNIGNHSTSQLGSKVIEYMAVGRPIINVVTLPDDTSLTALEDHPATLLLSGSDGKPVGDDIARLAAFLDNPPPIPQAYTASVIARHSPQTITREYSALLGRTAEAR